MGFKAPIRIQKNEDFKVGDLVIPRFADGGFFQSDSNDPGLVVGIDPYVPWALEVLINGKVVEVSSYTVKILSPG